MLPATTGGHESTYGGFLNTAMTGGRGHIGVVTDEAWRGRSFVSAPAYIVARRQDFTFQ